MIENVPRELLAFLFHRVTEKVLEMWFQVNVYVPNTCFWFKVPFFNVFTSFFIVVKFEDNVAVYDMALQDSMPWQI